MTLWHRKSSEDEEWEEFTTREDRVADARANATSAFGEDDREWLHVADNDA